MNPRTSPVAAASPRLIALPFPVRALLRVSMTVAVSTGRFLHYFGGRVCGRVFCDDEF